MAEAHIRQPETCPSCTLVAQAARVRERWPGAGRDFPLFPSRCGARITKEAALRTIRVAAVCLGLAADQADAEVRFSGHSLRGGGARAWPASASTPL